MRIGALNLSSHLRSGIHEKCLKAKSQQKPVIKFFAEKSDNTSNQTSPKFEVNEVTVVKLQVLQLVPI